ncbi:hypothetical protein As57867_005226, partial [Aphanomyces stellatus]
MRAVVSLLGAVAMADVFDTNFPVDFIAKIGASLTSPYDPVILIRNMALFATVWFDTLAPFESQAVGLHSNLGRVECLNTTRNKNIALAFATKRIGENLFPDAASQTALNAYFQTTFQGLGLNYNDVSATDWSKPSNIGNAAAAAVIAAHVNDGANQDGCLSGAGNKVYNKQRYGDYTGYTPVNTDVTLVDR